MTTNGYINKSKTDSWGTPPSIIEALGKKYGPLSTFDPCPLAKDPSFNGLKLTWGQFESDKPIFVNPPYSSLKTTKKHGTGWIDKAVYEANTFGLKIIMLIPVRSDTQWFHDVILKNGRIEFIPGRITFIDAETGEPAKSCCGFGCMYWFLNC